MTQVPGISSGDTAWVLTSTALVMLMTVGLAFFYGGLVRPKNALNTMMMSMIALGLVSVQWVLIGYSLAFSHDGGAFLGGFAWAGFRGVGLDPDPAYAATIPLQAHAMFQAMFAIITPALIAGAVVERMRFRAYVVFILLWATLVYDPLAHWVWGGGWLQKRGALDFAGGTVVHISAGVSAFVAARQLGPRTGFKRTPMVPHNVPLVLLGAGLLWFGWFGFNSGSALAANGVAALAFTNTNTAAAMAMVTWACCDLVRNHKITAVGAATGLVVGLVAITPAAGYVTAPASLVIGAVGALVSYVGIQIRTASRLDDSLDVFSCHGLGGITGALLTGVFATKLVNGAGGDGLLAGNAAQLGVQALAVLATVAFAGVATAVILALVQAVFGARAGVREELGGLDVSEHGEEAYFGGEASGPAGTGVGIGAGVIVSGSSSEPALLDARKA